MSDSIDRIRAWHAQQSDAREVTRRDGVPVAVREGSATSRYVWDDGELAELIEPDGTRFCYCYGEDGRLLAVDRDGRAFARYAYDEAGRLREVARPEGVVTHAYDGEGRLVRTDRCDAGAWAYRWQGSHVLAARGDREESRFDYDRAGRLIGLEQRVDGVAIHVRFGFDVAGRLEAIAFTDWEQTVDFAWDARGRPAEIGWNGRPVARFGTDDARHLAWSESVDGVREETLHEPAAGRPTGKTMLRNGAALWRSDLVRDDAFRIVREGERHYEYDAVGRLSAAREGGHSWRYDHDAMDNPVRPGILDAARDRAGRVRLVGHGNVERVFRYNQAGDMVDALFDGERVAGFVYDHKGRLVLKSGPAGDERYVYGADDGLLAIADADGRPRTIFLRLPTGIVAMVDFGVSADGEIACLHSDTQGNLVLAGWEDGKTEGPFASDPYGLPLLPSGRAPYIYRGRVWHEDVALYRIGARWYDPVLRQFLTPDTHTGAPDDARLVDPHRAAAEQRMARAGVLCDWLGQPRLRNRYAFCANDPVNRFDPNGHWSFGGVLLSLLGVIWTLPNTVFGLAIEITCLIGEVVRWLVWACSLGNVSWQTPGIDVASSGNLNAFALVFKGGWIGSFDSLLGITFGNVIFVHGEWQTASKEWQALPDTVVPPAYEGAVTIPKEQALYEHELRHVNQYGWWGPFFHLGLPLFGIYEWDTIINGYQNAHFEKDAREHAGY